MITELGALVWIAVTDHPDNPKTCAVGDSYAYRTEADCQAICDAWNSYGGGWRWYPLQVRVGEQPAPAGQGRLL